jgi:hypothetical protein
MEDRGEAGESMGSQEIENTRRLEILVWDSCELDLRLLGDAGLRILVSQGSIDINIARQEHGSRTYFYLEFSFS